MTYISTDQLTALKKTSDDLRARADQMDADRAQEQLEIRAEKELAHLPGSISDRAALLRAVDGIEDERQRKNALAALKLPDGMVSDDDTPRAGTPDSELDNLAKAHQQANPDVTIEAAYVEVLATAKGQQLYAKGLLSS